MTDTTEKKPVMSGATLSDRAVEIKKRLAPELAPEFEKLLEVLDQTDYALGLLVKKFESPADRVYFLQYCADLLTMKSASYVGSAVINHGIAPGSAFAGMQHRALVGLDATLQVHSAACANGENCAGGKLLGDFLRHMAGMMQRVEAFNAAVLAPEKPAPEHMN